MFYLEESDVSSDDQMNIDSEDEGDYRADEVEKDFDRIDANTTETTSPIVQCIKAKELEINLPTVDGQIRMREDVELPTTPTPLDFFNLFLTRNNVDYIVEQSNLYRTQEEF